MDTDMAPWSWPEERWRSAVARGRAGRSLRPKKWKAGARCALALTFDCSFETGAIDQDGGSIPALARGQYGGRAGVGRILRILARNKVHATFFMPAVSAMLHPEAAKAIAAGGHEIGLHTWLNENRPSLTIDAERELLAGARSALERVAGLSPSGFRAGRGGLSDHTLGLLKELGLTYDSSLCADDDPYEIENEGTGLGLVELPPGITDAILKDMLPGGGATTPEALFDVFRRELEVAYQEGGLVVLALDPAVIGRRANAWVLDEFIKVARALPGVWITTCADIAAFVRPKSA